MATVEQRQMWTRAYKKRFPNASISNGRIRTDCPFCNAKIAFIAFAAGEIMLVPNAAQKAHLNTF